MALAALAMSQSSCASLVARDHETETKFLLGPSGGNATFFGWSEITLDQDASSAGRATIYAVTMELTNPGEAGDLTFIVHLSSAFRIEDGLFDDQFEKPILAVLFPAAPGLRAIDDPKRAAP